MGKSRHTLYYWWSFACIKIRLFFIKVKCNVSSHIRFLNRIRDIVNGTYSRMKRGDTFYGAMTMAFDEAEDKMDEEIEELRKAVSTNLKKAHEISESMIETADDHLKK